jgi:hypothetical protein
MLAGASWSGSIKAIAAEAVALKKLISFTTEDTEEKVSGNRF